MHVFFSGIGGTGIGPLALIAKQAGYQVSGSDKSRSDYIDYLSKHGIDEIYIGQDGSQLAQAHQKRPVDWLVHTSALPAGHPELEFCRKNNVRVSKRDELLNQILKDKNLKLIAVAGTHGKTTTTAMAVWLFKHLGIPISYSVGAKLSFGEMGEFDPGSRYFAYEADEFDRNFLSFSPDTALITGLDWDHPDTYPTRQEYYQAFGGFIDQSKQAFVWREDAGKLGLKAGDKVEILEDTDSQIDVDLKLPGHVNRLNAWLVAKGLQKALDKPVAELVSALNEFPGLSRRFEQLAPNLFTDYAHTPPKIRGALQTAHETGGDKVVVVYEGLHNTRQHFIKDELKNLFDSVKRLYVVPSYLARENQDLELLTPDKLLNLLSNLSKSKANSARLDGNLKKIIESHLAAGDLVLCLSAGGAGSLDEWLRKEFA